MIVSVPSLIFFIVQCLTEYFMDMDQRGDLTDEPLCQLLLINPCGLRGYVTAGVGPRFRPCLTDGFLDREPLSVSADLKVFLQFA